MFEETRIGGCRKIRLKQYKELDEDIIVSKNYSKSKYPHLTFMIDNISDYMNIISLLSKTVKNDSFINGEIIYRGMANAEWDLKPTLADTTISMKYWNTIWSIDL